MSVPMTRERFASLVDTNGDCHEWTGYRDDRGYGHTGFTGRRIMAHRLAWLLAHGPIPDGLHVLHRCDNPPCVRLDHLYLGTHADNMRDAASRGRIAYPIAAVRAAQERAAARTHCPAGHLLDDANTNWARDHGRRSRRCRTCKRAAQETYRETHREALRVSATEYYHSRRRSA